MTHTTLPAATPPDLTDDEIAAICKPLTQPAAQIRYLEALGVRAARRRDGRPLVSRAHYVAVRGEQPGGAA